MVLPAKATPGPTRRLAIERQEGARHLSAAHAFFTPRMQSDWRRQGVITAASLAI